MSGWEGKDPREWAEEVKRKATDVYRLAAQKMVTHMNKPVYEGGRVPHRTGNLMRSMLASTTKMPNVGPPKKEYEGQDATLVIAQMELTDTLYVGFQANYARRMNYGFNGQDSLGRTYNHKGYHFVEASMLMWPQFLKEAAKELGFT